MTERIWEIDVARGLSVIGMVIFNYSFALNFLGKMNIDTNSGILFWLGRIVAFSFVFLAGMSLFLSANRARHVNPNLLIRKYLQRGGFVFLLGIGITAVTYLYNPAATIWFGVLHLIGLSIILAIPVMLKKWENPNWLLLLSAATIFAGFQTANISSSNPSLLWLGIWPAGWYTFDYFPLLPWFGVFMLGYWFGLKKYGRRMHETKNAPSNSAITLLRTLGRNSLIIYLIHQPLLLLGLKAASLLY